MTNPRTYGNPPYATAVIHGGPGAAGGMAPVAKELSRRRGILEPLQTEPTVDGQVRELHSLLQKHADLPVTMIGHSWGAWLSFIFASRYTGMVKKLILIGSGPFEEEYVPSMQETRLRRLTAEEQKRIETLTQSLDDPAAKDNREALTGLGAILSRADSFAASSDDTPVEIRPDIFNSVMDEAGLLRKSGALLAMGKLIECPVVAIHGDYDPHPYRGVAEPLSRVLGAFRMILLKKCGHYPWKEQYARDDFYSILTQELQ
jgi:pimeloyl-ACP methyl ester carboxylesterase